jgi:serine phosphatase RsbU (regulator of sigma subunit)
MLKLEDFFHLPQLDPLVEQLVAGEPPGLVIVAGLDPLLTTAPETGGGFLPSGRQTIFRILMRQILEANPSARAIIVAEDETLARLPRRTRPQAHLLTPEPPRTYASCIASAARQRPDLLVVEQLDAESAPAALRAAQDGLRVLAQLNTVFRGAGVAHHLLDLGMQRQQLEALGWVVTVGRLPALCPRCKRPFSPALAHLAELRCRYPLLRGSLERATFFRAAGCAECNHTGRQGDVAVFDVFCAAPDAPAPLEQASQLPLQTYLLGLAALGYLALDDVTRFDADQLRRAYRQLAASESALAESNSALQRKLAQLEAANRVLQGRTEAIISLQDMGQALVSLTELRALAARVCRHARNLCGADRAILYFLHPDDEAEILAVSGWDPALVQRRLGASLVFAAREGNETRPSNAWPPGVPERHPDVEGVNLRAGLRVPLAAQGERVGLMMVHTTRRAGFEPGKAALLQTFANQAALAIQRAGLIEALQEKVEQLQAAQAELVQKERLEREMELARQVQQSVLPRVFPALSGYAFAARNQPARQVGGDFYDVFWLDAERVGLVVADVSDKGMPAALYMALTRSLLLAEARREASPRAVLNNVHRLLLELGEQDMFVTVFYGVVEAGRLTYARAGHDRPLLLREGVAQTLGGKGIFLGFPDLEELNLSEEQVDLAPGDRLVLYTDGLTDALAPDEQPFGLQRLTALLQSQADLPPAELCAATFECLLAYQGQAEQYDDMTMLVMEVR